MKKFLDIYVIPYGISAVGYGLYRVLEAHHSIWALYALSLGNFVAGAVWFRASVIHGDRHV